MLTEAALAASVVFITLFLMKFNLLSKMIEF
nr:MAG TPA: hypothetical protein [Caudoviricetes sp.]